MSFAIDRERANALLTDAIAFLNSKDEDGPRMKEHHIGLEIGDKGRAMVSQIRTRPNVLPSLEKQLALMALAEYHGWQGWDLYKAEMFGLPKGVALNGTTDDEDHAIHDHTTVARLSGCRHKKITGYKIVIRAASVAIQEVVEDALEAVQGATESVRPRRVKRPPNLTPA